MLKSTVRKTADIHSRPVPAAAADASLTNSASRHLDAEAAVRVLLAAEDRVVVRLDTVLPVCARLPDRRQDAGREERQTDGSVQLQRAEQIQQCIAGADGRPEPSPHTDKS